MNSYRHVRSSLTTPSRRTFVKGLAVGGAAASLGLMPSHRLGATARTRQTRRCCPAPSSICASARRPSTSPAGRARR